MTAHVTEDRTEPANAEQWRWRDNPRFVRLVIGNGVSATGSAISIVALPLLAVAGLGAGPSDLAALGIAALVPGMMVDIPMSRRLDRLHDKVTWYAMSHAVIGVATLAIPVAFLLGVLSMPLLIALVAVEALVRTVSSTLGSTVTTVVVDDDALVPAAGVMSAVQSATNVAGQGLGGVIMRIASAPVAMLIDGLSSIVGAVVLRTLSGLKAPLSVIEDQMGEAVVDPRRVAIITRTLRSPLVWALVGLAFFGGIVETSLAVLAVTERGLAPSTVGLMLATGAVGGVAGGLAVRRLDELVGRRLIVACLVLSGLSVIPLVAFNGRTSTMISLVVFEVLSALAGTIAVSKAFGELQQSAIATASVAQVMAVASTTMQLGALVGLVFGGVAGAVRGVEFSLLAASGMAILIGFVFLVVGGRDPVNRAEIRR